MMKNEKQNRIENEEGTITITAAKEHTSAGFTEIFFEGDFENAEAVVDAFIAEDFAHVRPILRPITWGFGESFGKKHFYTDAPASAFQMKAEKINMEIETARASDAFANK